MTLTWLTRWTNSNTWSRQKKCTFLMREISFVFISKTSFFCNYTFCFLVWHMGFKDVVHHPTLTDVTWQKKHKSVELLFFCFVFYYVAQLAPDARGLCSFSSVPEVTHSCSWIASLSRCLSVGMNLHYREPWIFFHASFVSCFCSSGSSESCDKHKCFKLTWLTGLGWATRC